MAAHETLLLLGEDNTDWGAVGIRAGATGRVACAISRGRRPALPSSAPTKVDPNEDAVLALDDGDAVLLAVADAHHGREAGHRLLERIAAGLRTDLPSLHALAEALAGLAGAGGETPSETTLAVAVCRRSSRRGFGLSFGDSSVFLVGGGEPPRRLAAKRHAFVRPGDALSLARERAVPFRFVGGPGRLLVAFTDGVDECCYGRPALSVGPAHLDDLLRETGALPEAYARALANLALEGVGGNPGGEDNLAVAVATTA